MRNNNGTILFMTVMAFFLLMWQSSWANAKQFKKGVKAPSWGNTQWINLPPGKKSLDVEDYRGKVVYLALFQEW